ncbi:MAG: helix-turn-helix transcriptional regulator [Mucilaginibacter sp.]
MKNKITLRPIMIDITGVTEFTGLSKTTICDLINKGDFPKPRKVSARGARWLVREIEEWAESRPISDILPPPNTGRNAAA